MPTKASPATIRTVPIIAGKSLIVIASSSLPLLFALQIVEPSRLSCSKDSVAKKKTRQAGKSCRLGSKRWDLCVGPKNWAWKAVIGERQVGVDGSLSALAGQSGRFVDPNPARVLIVAIGVLP